MASLAALRQAAQFVPNTHKLSVPSCDVQTAGGAGAGVGGVVGSGVGSLVGASVGMCVGGTVGRNVGRMVGSSVGSLVGWSVVKAGVGATVVIWGAKVTRGVGAAVDGTSLAHCSPPEQPRTMAMQP